MPDQPGPNPHLLIASGKEGVIYVIDRDTMGGFNTAKDLVVQRIPAVPGTTSPIGVKYGNFAYFNGSIYGVGSPLRVITPGMPDKFPNDVLPASEGLLEEEPAGSHA